MSRAQLVAGVERASLDNNFSQQGAQQSGMEDQEGPTPRLIKKIAVAYDLKALPLILIQSYNVLRRRIERAGFRIEVILRPLTGLPPEVEVVFVPEERVEAARQAAPEARLMLLVTGTTHQPAYDELLQQLNAGQEIYALRQEGETDQEGRPRRVIVRYRGNERIG